jgi:hypothetical protein
MWDRIRRQILSPIMVGKCIGSLSKMRYEVIEVKELVTAVIPLAESYGNSVTLLRVRTRGTGVKLKECQDRIERYDRFFLQYGGPI